MVMKNFSVEGMNCKHCVKAIELELEEMNLESFKVEIGSVEVKFNIDNHSEEDIINAIDEACFKVV